MILYILFYALSRPIYRGAFDQRRQMLGRGAVAGRGVGDATQTPFQRLKPRRDSAREPRAGALMAGKLVPLVR